MKQITDTDEIWQYFLDWYSKQFTVDDRATILGLRQDNWIAYKAGWLEGVSSHKKEIIMTTSNRFIKNNDNQVILDTETNLEWLVKDDKDIAWDEANEWAKNLGDNWRLPTLKELKSLYDTSQENNINPIFNFFEEYFWVWSGELNSSDSSSAWYLYFGSGGGDWDDRVYSDGSRVLAVRSGGRSFGYFL